MHENSSYNMKSAKSSFPISD